jgi:tryptophanyl-tRNA synthetase
MHSLTSVFEPAKMIEYTNNAIIDMLALGINPKTSIFWVQSDVPEVAELTWYLNNITPVGLLERCHSYKDKLAKGLAASNGLFSYPVLMAADILMYQSNIVPVGKDQKQHVEVTRDIAIKFNMTYGEVFTIPEPEIQESVAVIPGVDGQKMSKSYGNTIDIFSTEKELKKKVMSIVTDPSPVEAPKDPDTNTIYNIYKLFAEESKAQDMAAKFRAGGFGYGDAKKELLSVLWDYFSPYRAEREKIAADKEYIAGVRKLGADKARSIATVTLDKVRNVVGII